MARILILFVSLVEISCSFTYAQETEEALLAARDPEIQEQLHGLYDGLLRNAELFDGRINCDIDNKVERLNESTEDKAELVRQLAIFMATAKNELDLVLAGKVLSSLELPASIPIRVLAPHLDAKNEKLREFAGL
jgi:hypothetical protein